MLLTSRRFSLIRLLELYYLRSHDCSGRSAIALLNLQLVQQVIDEGTSRMLRQLKALL
ncbi:MAG: hypothetical protein AB1589_38230 [Cyanobacteriota bacterium]